MRLVPLLARGRDRLETIIVYPYLQSICNIPYSLGDAIDWKFHVERSE